MTETLTALDGLNELDLAPGTTRGSFAGARRTGGGAQLHRRVLGRCGDLDSRGTDRRALAATGLG
jgi:hypothetical protein